MIEDPLLGGYNTRRDMHAGKLALIVALGRGARSIRLADLEIAWEYMFEAEVDMPKALSNAGGNIYRMQEETVIAFVEKEYVRTQKPIHEREVRRRLGRIVSTTMIAKIVDELFAQGRMKQMYAEMNKTPNRLLKPGAR